MRRLRAILLQDLAVLQPRFPSLPFFAYPPFSGPDWDDFVLAVQSDVAASEPPSLRLQRALPEINAAFESSRDTVLLLALYGALPPQSGQCASPPTFPLVLWCSFSAPPSINATTSPLRSHLQECARTRLAGALGGAQFRGRGAANGHGRNTLAVRKYYYSYTAMP